MPASQPKLTARSQGAILVAASVGFAIGLGNVSAFIKGSETISVQSV